MPGSASVSNRLLARLAQADRDALLPHLKRTELMPGQVLHDTGQPISVVYFPHGGIVSLVICLASGDTVEAATVGRDGVVGAAAALTGTVAANRAIVQLRATAAMIEAGALRQLADRNAGLRTNLMLYHH